MAFNPTSMEGMIAMIFIVISGVLMIILLTTCIICCCWRYKLHKRKMELKAKNAEQGIVSPKKSPGCRCCGCWMYCCRCCRGCCEHKPAAHDDQVVVVQPTEVPPMTHPCGSRSNDQYGWSSKDVYVYNNGPATSAGCGGGAVGGGGCGSQPVNFNNRWSSSNDGRLVLNGGGLASKVIPGASTYGGIYPTVPGGNSPNNQFMFQVRK